MNRIIIVLFLGLLVNTYALADNNWQDIQFHGFISQAYISSNNNYATPSSSSNGNFEFREIGFTMFWDVSDDLSLVGGLLSRKFGDVDNGSIKLDYLLLDYKLYSASMFDIGIRAGRVKNKMGLYNVARDMPTSHPGILLPPSIYFESFRDMLLSTDGINLYTNVNSDLGVLSLDIFSGTRKNTNNSLENYVFQQMVPGKFDTLNSRGLHIELLPNALPNLYMSITSLKVDTQIIDYPTLSTEELSQAGYDLSLNPTLYKNYTNSLDLKTQLDNLAIRYSKDKWTLSAEYTQINTKLNNVEVLFQQVPGQDITSEGYYAQLEYAFTTNLQGFIRYDDLMLNNKDPKGVQAEKNGSYDHGYSLYSHGTTVGFRYALRHNISLNSEYSSYQGTAWLPLFDELNHSMQKKNWHIAAIQLVFDF